MSYFGDCMQMKLERIEAFVLLFVTLTKVGMMMIPVNTWLWILDSIHTVLDNRYYYHDDHERPLWSLSWTEQKVIAKSSTTPLHGITNRQQIHS